MDTVYLGAFRKERFDTLGGFRAFRSGSSEDADFYYRWRKQGWSVLVDPSIVSKYTPRDGPLALWRQYFRYGMGKSEMLWVNGRWPSWRPLAPMGLVVGIVLGLVLLRLGLWWPIAVMLSGWLALVLVVAIRSDEDTFQVLAAGAIMHLAYGLGLLRGLAGGPSGSMRLSS